MAKHESIVSFTSRLLHKLGIADIQATLDRVPFTEPNGDGSTRETHCLLRPLEPVELEAYGLNSHPHLAMATAADDVCGGRVSRRVIWRSADAPLPTDSYSCALEIEAADIVAIDHHTLGDWALAPRALEAMR